MLPFVLTLACTGAAEAPAVFELPIATAAAAETAPTTPNEAIAEPVVHASDSETLATRAATAGIAMPPPNPRILIDKSERRLELYSGDTLLKTYRAAFGDPKGDKVRQGDLKTPTGEFYVVTRNAKSSYHLFLGLSYPMPEDAERGLEAGLTTAEQATAITAAGTERGLPPWNTTLGGAIGIHGNGGDYDWTLGCIAVDDDEIEELWAVTTWGTRVVVQE